MLSLLPFCYLCFFYLKYFRTIAIQISINACNKMTPEYFICYKEVAFELLLIWTMLDGIVERLNLHIQSIFNNSILRKCMQHSMSIFLTYSALITIFKVSWQNKSFVFFWNKNRYIKGYLYNNFLTLTVFFVLL